VTARRRSSTTWGIKWINHWSAGAHFKRPDQARDFMLGLPYAVKHAAAGCDLALYQAGADQHLLTTRWAGC
jgi:hypothetical protein